jgi:transcriptional regulator with XRE-family HTH domain
MNEDLLQMQFGSHLREKRDKLGLSQEALANEAGLHRTYVSAVERGRRNPTLVSLSRLAKALGISVSELLVGVGQ